MHRTPRLLAALLGALAAAPSLALVTTEPPSVTVEPGKAAEVSIKWVFTREAFDDLASDKGEFVALFGHAPLEVVRVRLPARLTRGSGAVVEKVTIPTSLTDAMRSRGLTRVSYLRRFGDHEAAVEVVLGVASGKLTVDGLELAFPGGGAEVSVVRGGRVPAAEVTVRYQGAGLLEAAWELDGKVHARVSQVLDVLGMARFESPELPPLPTGAPGTHRLRFVPARTVRGLEVPAVTYLVTADAPAAALAPLALTAPASDAALPFEAVRLGWARGAGAVFLVDLRDCESGAALFSAYTRELAYRLPAFGVSPHLTPGRVLCWRVVSFDEAGLAVEASEVRRLKLVYPRGAP